MKILIVEDEVLLAMELESELETNGHTVIGLAMSSREAFSILNQSVPDFAFVDIHLKDGPSGIEVGRRLTKLDIPFVFVTGNLKRIPDDFAGALGAIEKPYTGNGFRHALDYLTRYVNGEDELPSPPPSVVLPKLVEFATWRGRALNPG